MINYKDLFKITRFVRYTDSCWEEHEWLAFQKDSNRPYSGISDKFSPGGNLNLRYTFEKGRVISEEFHSDLGYTKRTGLIKWRRQYKKDGGIDFIEEFYKTGELRIRTKWDDHLHQEYHAIYRPSGRLRLHQERSDSYLYKEEFYKTGELKSKANYSDIYKEGPFETYYKSGELCIRCNFKWGHKHGICDYFYRNGQLKKKNTFKEGQKDGPQFFFDNEGNLKRTEIWKNGELKKERNRQ